MTEDRLRQLIARLSEPDKADRVAAAQALGEMGHPDAIDALVTALTDQTAGVRQAALMALGKIGLAQDVPTGSLIPLLADNDDETRQIATNTLANLGARAVVALIDGLYHRNSTVRGAAADLLGTLQDDRAHDALVEVSRTDPSRWVRSRAKDALDQLQPATSAKSPNGPKLSPPPDTLELVRSQAAELPSLDDKPAPTNSDALTADQIRAMLDNLDLRLANGEISEETYHTLYARWQTRLADLDR